MIDRDKVIAMTKAAMDDSKNRKKSSPAKNYFADDYVSVQVLKGILGMTVVYVLLVSCWALYTADVWMLYSLERILEMGKYLGILYLCVLLATILILVLIYTLRYSQARRALREQQNDLRRVRNHYEHTEKRREE
ncbi:MAG: hypothetical protein LUF00_03935 [Lachnospiraceae bacterium]|nr:hypothetical protein [Lachnospiraceae bacterium]